MLGDRGWRQEGGGAPERWIGTFARAEVRRDDPGVVADRRRRSLGDHSPGFEAVHAIGDAHDERHVVLDHQHRGAELALDAHDEWPERLRFPLCDAARRFVEQQHACVDGEERPQLHDPAGAGRQVRHELVGVAPEAEEVDQLGRLGALVPLGRRGRREPRHRRHEPRTLSSFERHHDRLAHGERREQPRRLEAATQPDPVPAVGGQAAHVSAEQFHDAVGLRRSRRSRS